MKTFECLDCGETFEGQSRPDGHHEHAYRCGTFLQWNQGQVIGEKGYVTGDAPMLCGHADRVRPGAKEPREVV
jgi:hypothetical protein